MKVKPPPPAQRRVLVYLSEKGVLTPQDDFPVKAQTLERLLERGWISFIALSNGGQIWHLTEAGRAAYPWPSGQT